MCYLAASNDRLVGTASTLPKEPKDPVEAEPWLEVWKTPVGQSYEGVAGDCGHAGCPGQGCGGEDLPHEEPGHRAQSQGEGHGEAEQTGEWQPGRGALHSAQHYSVHSPVSGGHLRQPGLGSGLQDPAGGAQCGEGEGGEEAGAAQQGPPPRPRQEY